MFYPQIRFGSKPPLNGLAHRIIDISPGGAAAAHPDIRPGDALVAINGLSLTGVPHDKVAGFFANKEEVCERVMSFAGMRLCACMCSIALPRGWGGDTALVFACTS